MDKTSKKFCGYKNNNFVYSTAGFTLIELLIAVAVFFIGLMAAFSLSLYNLNTAKENAYRVVAADLAREGLEIVRNIRDSNWLSREANVDNPDTIANDIYVWDHGLDWSNFTVDYTQNVITHLGSQGDSLDAVIARPETRLYINNDFFYGHSAGQITGFSRAIHIQALCLNTAPSATPPIETISGNLLCSAGLEKIGLQVTSRVQYTYGNKTSHIDAVENIYNLETIMKVDNSKGFTLIEMLVAIAIFALVATLASSMFSTFAHNQKRTKVSQELLNNAQYALEIVSREIKNNEIIGFGTDQCNGLPYTKCLLFVRENSEIAGFIFDGNELAYVQPTCTRNGNTYSNCSIPTSQTPTTLLSTSFNKTKINSLDFRLTPSTNPYFDTTGLVNQQPKVTINMIVEYPSGLAVERVIHHLQTTVSSRVYKR